MSRGPDCWGDSGVSLTAVAGDGEAATTPGCLEVDGVGSPCFNDADGGRVGEARNNTKYPYTILQIYIHMLHEPDGQIV